MIGFLVVDKPPGITSHDVVGAVRAVTGIKKVGHTGTLDPFATGVLAVAVGPATRLSPYLDESIKIYDALIRLGSATDTGDPTGEVIRTAEVPELTEAAVRAVLDGFLGEQDQVPPPYSAVKHKGKPLYWYARRGETVEVAPRRIVVHALDLEELGEDHLRVCITCGRGTYARVLADDIATALGTAGHLEALARRRSGPFLIDDALDFPSLAEIVAEEPGRTWQEVFFERRREARVPWKPRDTVREALTARLMRPMQALSHLPLLDVDGDVATRVRHGNPPPTLPPAAKVGDRYLVVEGSDLLAVAELQARGPRLLRVIGGI